MKRLLFALFVLALAMPAMAEEFGQTVSVTNTSQTITFAGPRSSVNLYNCSDGTTPTCSSANSAFFRLFNCTETPSAATTANGTPLANGESVAFQLNYQTVPSTYCSLTIISSGTATVRIIAQ